jgi:hypothetical protein
VTLQPHPFAELFPLLEGTACDREILAATSRIICALRGKLNEFEPDDIQVRLTKRAPASPAVARLGELQDGGDA